MQSRVDHELVQSRQTLVDVRQERAHDRELPRASLRALMARTSCVSIDTFSARTRVHNQLSSKDQQLNVKKKRKCMMKCGLTRSTEEGRGKARPTANKCEAKRARAGSRMSAAQRVFMGAVPSRLYCLLMLCLLGTSTRGGLSGFDSKRDGELSSCAG